MSGFTLEPAITKIEHNTLLCVRLALRNSSPEKVILPSFVGEHGTVVVQLRPESGDWFQVRSVATLKCAFYPLRSQELLPKSSLVMTEAFPFLLKNDIWKSGKYRMRALIVYSDTPNDPEFISEETELDIQVDDEQRSKPSPGWKALCDRFQKGHVLPLKEESLNAFLSDIALPAREKRLLQWFAAVGDVFQIEDPRTKLKQLQKCRDDADAFDPVTRDFLRYKLGCQAVEAKDLAACCNEMLSLNTNSRKYRLLVSSLSGLGYRCINGVPVLNKVDGKLQ